MTDWLAHADGDRVAVDGPGFSLTYEELARAAAAAPPDGPAVLPAEPSRAFVVALHAHLAAEVPAVIADPRRPDRPSASAADHSAALVVFTSGTTGHPQPVALSGASIRASAQATASRLERGPETRWLCPLPLAHVGGLMVMLRAALGGFTAVLGGIERLGEASIASLVPTQLQRLLEGGPVNGPEIVLGGAGAPRSLLVRARQAGLRVRTTYGLTQTCSMVALAEPGDLESSGSPLPGVRIQIADDGEIVVEGPMVAGAVPHRTGDLGRLLDDGRLVVSGRKSDLIVSGGENVSPAAVEAVLLEHPAVADAAVFGRPHPKWGEAVTARIVPRAGEQPDPEELRAFCRGRLAPFEIPKSFEITREALPRTQSGKLRRNEIA